MTRCSMLVPEQPSDPASMCRFAQCARELGLARLWVGQSFNVESHLALGLLAGGEAIPVGIGTALAALRTPYDAALQARSVAAVLGQPVSVAYGAADPDFVRSVRGAPLARPASYTAEYARIVRCLLTEGRAHSAEPGVETDATLPALATPAVEVGTGVLRTGMAARSRDLDFVTTWLTPPHYLADALLPALRREDGSTPRIVSNVACAVERPGRSVQLMAQAGMGNHLAMAHYTAMLRQAGIDAHPSDPVSGTREAVRHGVLAHGSPHRIAKELASYGDSGVDEVVINMTPVALVHGVDEALRDLCEIADALSGAPSREG